MVSQRTWQHVLDEIIKLKSGPTQYRWQSAAKDKAFDLIPSRLLIETQAEHFLEVLKKGTVSTNAFLRKTHNFALDMNWLPASVIPKRQWPAIRYKDKRAITFEEHQRFNVPVWAALNTSLLKAWEPPEGLLHVTVFGDNDSNFAGQAAAYELASRGIITMDDLAEQSVDDLLSLPQMDEDRAAKLITKAREPWFSEQKGE